MLGINNLIRAGYELDNPVGVGNLYEFVSETPSRLRPAIMPFSSPVKDRHPFAKAEGRFLGARCRR
jgi:hypothetical protein